MSNSGKNNNDTSMNGFFFAIVLIIAILLAGIFIQNFSIMEYEKKIAFSVSGRTSSAGIENPKGWEEADEKALDDFDIEGAEDDTASKEIKDSSERTFTTKPYEEVTTTATTMSNVAVSDGVLREATTKKDDVETLIENSYGEKVAIYARDFYKEYHEKVHYGIDFELRKKAYWLIPEDDGTFKVDCVGLVNLVVHNATGFSLPDEGEYTGFVIPESERSQMAQVFEPFEFHYIKFIKKKSQFLLILLYYKKT